jgi:RNA polymerase sigma factor (sigma-70 family)
MTDGQLLECFVTHRDEAAFEALVRLHGPMVLGVCRRVLGNVHDAEDAFQATFLVLVRKAASIGQRELLGNWLYGVAYRTALDARAATSRRRQREKQVSVMPEPEAADRTDLWCDLRPLLDQELNRLPNKYRVSIVLCDLEGRTRREVAQHLGIPEGTLSGRLTTARRLLARRLTRRRLTLSSGVLAAALSQGAAPACVPSPLLVSTVQSAMAVAAGKEAAGVVSAEVAALTEGVLKAMFVTRLKITAAVLLVAAAVLGAALFEQQPIAAQLQVVAAGKRADKEAGDAGKPRVLKLAARGRGVAWSPDGKTLVVVTKVEKFFLGYKYDGKGSAIELWDVEKGQARKTLAESKEGGLAFQQVVFAPDGKSIAATVSQEVRKPNMLMIRDVVKVWDAKTLVLKQMLTDDSQLVCVALSADGKRIAAGDPSKKRVLLWNARTGALERTLRNGEAQPWSVAFSPDSKTLVVGGQKADHSGVVTLWNVETGKLIHTLEQEHYVNRAVLSPDGKMIASGGGGKEIELWDVGNGKQIRSLEGFERGTRSVAFSPDGKMLAAGGPDGKVRLWSVASGKLKETLEGHGAQIYAIAFSPDGKTLASVSQDQTLRLWKMNKRLVENK